MNIRSKVILLRMANQLNQYAPGQPMRPWGFSYILKMFLEYTKKSSIPCTFKILQLKTTLIPQASILTIRGAKGVPSSLKMFLKYRETTLSPKTSLVLDDSIDCPCVYSSVVQCVHRHLYCISLLRSFNTPVITLGEIFRNSTLPFHIELGVFYGC